MDVDGLLIEGGDAFVREEVVVLFSLGPCAPPQQDKDGAVQDRESGTASGGQGDLPVRKLFFSKLRRA